MGACAGVGAAPAVIPAEFVGRWAKDPASLVSNLQSLSIDGEEEYWNGLFERRRDAGCCDTQPESGSFAWLFADMDCDVIEYTKATSSKRECRSLGESGYVQFTSKTGYRGRVAKFSEQKWKAFDSKLFYTLSISGKEYIDFEGTPLLVAFVLNGVRLERVITFEDDNAPALLLLISEMAEDLLQEALRAIQQLHEKNDVEQTDSVASTESSETTTEGCHA